MIREFGSPVVAFEWTGVRLLGRARFHRHSRFGDVWPKTLGRQYPVETETGGGYVFWPDAVSPRSYRNGRFVWPRTLDRQPRDEREHPFVNSCGGCVRAQRNTAYYLSEQACGRTVKMDDTVSYDGAELVQFWVRKHSRYGRYGPELRMLGEFARTLVIAGYRGAGNIWRGCKNARTVGSVKTGWITRTLVGNVVEIEKPGTPGENARVSMTVARIAENTRGTKMIFTAWAMSRIWPRVVRPGSLYTRSSADWQRIGKQRVKWSLFGEVAARRLVSGG